MRVLEREPYLEGLDLDWKWKWNYPGVYLDSVSLVALELGSDLEGAGPQQPIPNYKREPCGVWIEMLEGVYLINSAR